MPEQVQVGRQHSPVLLGQVLGVEVKDRQPSVGKLFEVGVLHEWFAGQASPRFPGALRVPGSEMADFDWRLCGAGRRALER